MLILPIFSLLSLILAIFLNFTANNFWSFFFVIAFVYTFTYLKDLGPQKVMFLIGYNKLKQMNNFRGWKRQYVKISQMELCFLLNRIFI